MEQESYERSQSKVLSDQTPLLSLRDITDFVNNDISMKV